MIIAVLRTFGGKYLDQDMPEISVVNGHTIRKVLDSLNEECSQLYPNFIVKDSHLTKEVELEVSPIDIEPMLAWLSTKESFQHGYAHVEMVKREEDKELVQIIIKNSQILFIVEDEVFEKGDNLYDQFLRLIITLAKSLNIQSCQVNRNDYSLLKYESYWGRYPIGHFHLFTLDTAEGFHIEGSMAWLITPIEESKYFTGRYPVKAEGDGYFSITLEESWDKPLPAEARDYFLFEVVKNTKYESY